MSKKRSVIPICLACRSNLNRSAAPHPYLCEVSDTAKDLRKPSVPYACNPISPSCHLSLHTRRNGLNPGPTNHLCEDGIAVKDALHLLCLDSCRYDSLVLLVFYFQLVLTSTANILIQQQYVRCAVNTQHFSLE